MKSVSKLLIQVSSSFVWKCPYIYSAHIRYGHLGDRTKWPLWGGRGDFLGSRTWRNMFIVAGSCLL